MRVMVRASGLSDIVLRRSDGERLRSMLRGG